MATRVNKERAFDFSETDFANLVKRKSFVDKTWMIREIFSGSSRILITAPPRFGKSTNIDMIKRFLETEVDLTQKTKNIHATKNYKLFKGNNLNICSDDVFFQEHFGKHPVVHVDFEPLSDVHDFTDMIDALSTVITKSFNQHSYVMHEDTPSSVNSDTAKNTKNNVFSDSNHNKFVNEGRKYFEMLTSSRLIRDVNGRDFMYSFQYLSKVLNKYFGKKVFVLIDNYDAYIKSVLLRKDNSPDTEKIISFIKATVSNLLCETTYVEQALLTGVIPVIDDGCRINGCYIDCYWFMGNHPFCEHFGLTSNELDNVLEKFDLVEYETIETKVIPEWKSSYLSPGKKVQVYNIWSVLHYIHGRRIENDNRYIKFYQPLFKNVSIRYKTSLLLLNEDIELDAPRSLSTTDILELKKVALNSADEDASFSVADTLFLLLYHFGCLSIRKYLTNGFASFQTSNDRSTYEMANAYLEGSPPYFIELVYKIWSTINSFGPYDSDEENTFETFCDCINTWYQTLPSDQQNLFGFMPSLLVALLTCPTLSNTVFLESRVICVNKPAVRIYITAKEAAEDGMVATMNAAKSAFKNICNPHSDRFGSYVFIAVGYRNCSDGVYTICSYKKREFSRYTHRYGFLHPKTIPYAKIFLVGLFIIIGARYLKTSK